MESQDHVRLRRRGFAIDGAELERELAIRGLTAKQLAHAAGVSQDTVGRARRGMPVDPLTLNKLVDALERIPARRRLTKLAPEVVAS